MDFIPTIDRTDLDDHFLKLINNEIDKELSLIDTNILHKRISYNHNDSLSEHNSKLLPISENGLKPFMEYDLKDKYTGNNNNIDLKLLASYSSLRNLRNNQINQIVSNSQVIDNLLIIESHQLKHKLDELDNLLSKKRKILDDVSKKRKKQSIDFKPINDFLYNRWNEKINQLIDLQITAFNNNDN